MALTGKKLGKILYKEFEKEGWGLMDTGSFKNPQPYVASSDSEDLGLLEVLDRVAEKLNKLYAKTKGDV